MSDGRGGMGRKALVCQKFTDSEPGAYGMTCSDGAFESQCLGMGWGHAADSAGAVEATLDGSERARKALLCVQPQAGLCWGS